MISYKTYSLVIIFIVTSQVSSQTLDDEISMDVPSNDQVTTLESVAEESNDAKSSETNDFTTTTTTSKSPIVDDPTQTSPSLNNEDRYSTTPSATFAETYATNNSPSTETATFSNPYSDVTTQTSPAPITISLPTFTPNTTVYQSTTKTSLCGENEIYSCLPLCPRTCNNPLSQLLCRPVPSRISTCRRGCTCKRGYLLEKMLKKCVVECPRKQHL